MSQFSSLLKYKVELEKTQKKKIAIHPYPYFTIIQGLAGLLPLQLFQVILVCFLYFYFTITQGFTGFTGLFPVTLF